MSRIKTETVEQIYSVLEKYAEASPRYYDREGFIYQLGVVPNPPKKIHINCMDGKKRIFLNDGELKMIGKGEEKVNSIIRKLLSNEN